MIPFIRRLIVFIIVLGLAASSFLGLFTVDAQSEVEITYRTTIRQNKEIKVDFYANGVNFGFFKLRTFPNVDKPFSIFLDYFWSKGLIQDALGAGVTISSVAIIYEIYDGNKSVASSAIYSSATTKIIHIPRLVRDAKDLVRYDVRKLIGLATIVKDGKIIGGVTVDILEEMRNIGLDHLSFTQSLDRHTLTFNTEVKDAGWIETEILRRSKTAGLIRLVGDPHFKDAKILYATFQIYDYESALFYEMQVDVTALDVVSHNEIRLNYTLLPGEEFFMPGTVTLADLGVTEYDRIKNFNITSLVLTLKTPVTEYVVNATELIGTIFYKAVAGPTLISGMELRVWRELGNGWFYWQVAAHTDRKLNNAKVIFTPKDGSISPIFVKVVSYNSVENGGRTLLLDVLALFDTVGVFDGNITVRTLLENFEVRDYSLKVHSQVTEVASQTVENIGVQNLTSTHLSENLEFEIHRMENLLRYALVPAEEEPEVREALEDLREELATLTPSEDYIEYAFPINQTIGKYDYVTLSYHYDLKLSGNSVVEITYALDIRDDGYKDPLSLFPAGLDNVPKAEYWPSSFIGSRFTLKQSGSETMTVGYVTELYDDEWRPVDHQYLEGINIRFLNAESVNISNVTLQLHRVVPPHREFPYAYSAVVSDTFDSRSSLLRSYLERGPLLWLLFIFSGIIVSYNLAVTIRNRRNRIEG